jgi:hypothetical protein
MESVLRRVLFVVRALFSFHMHGVLICKFTEFVAMPLGSGYTVEGQLTGGEVCTFMI